MTGAEELAGKWVAQLESRAAYINDLYKPTAGDAAAGVLGSYVCRGGGVSSVVVARAI